VSKPSIEETQAAPGGLPSLEQKENLASSGGLTSLEETHAVPGELLSLDETHAATGGLESKRAVQRTSPPGGAARLQASNIIGRYVVLSKLGAGGMGVVYLAYDPELNRKVALKLLLADPGSGTKHDEQRERLLREAQALAKFSHPEIVAVYDVGEHRAGVWIAMEFVDGQTLGAWASAQPRSWQEVVEVMIAAGRGVAAAHAAGLIHRDLKPDNIMIGNDARVRVMDFGLTRPQADIEPVHAVASEQSLATDLLSKPLTQHGSLLGTPAYMAPEQFSGGEVTAATDQFAYCVTLWELLFGERPFAGKTLMEVITSVLDGRIKAPPKRKVPSWLRRVCERGLSVEPSKRWPSMQDLLAELGRGQARVRRRNVAIGLGVAAAMIGALAGGRELERRSAIEACEAEGATISREWNDETRKTIERALGASGASYTANVISSVLPGLDAQSQAWEAARTEICQHGNSRTRAEPWDADTLDRALWCLEDRRLELAALLTELAGENPMTAARAVQAVSGLSPIDVCLDHVWLTRLPGPPTEGRPEVEAVRAKLSRAAALQATGNYAAGLELARESLAQAEALAWPPLTAAARLRVGTLLDYTGPHEEAAATLEQAYFEAAKIDAYDVAADAAVRLVLTIGMRLGRPADGRGWYRHAEVALTKFPDPQRLREAKLLNSLAHIERESGALDEAERLMEQTLELRQQALGPEHGDLANTLTNLALVIEAKGDYAEARALYERALAIVQERLGADHPENAPILGSLADVYRLAGEYEQAKQALTRALEIKEKVYGPEHPGVATTLHNLALVLESMGAHAEARPLHERCLSIFEKKIGPEHPQLAMALSGFADNLRMAGEYEQALAVHERALAMKEKLMGPEHTSVADSLASIALVHQAMGELDLAKTASERALAMLEKQLGTEHPQLAYPLFTLAEIALAQTRPADALPLAERSLLLREKAGSAPAEIAKTRFLVARALWDTGARAKAIERAEQARAAMRELGNAKTLAEIEGWLASHAP
jgi:tetratricopeptide (TPR) repeat protein/predicted Ser/Thr protein kinase